MGQLAQAFMGYFRRPRKLAGFSGVASGGLATLRFPGGKLIHEITLVSNATAAQITYAEVKRNGETVFKLSGTQMQMLERYKKRWEETGRHVITFSDLTMSSMGDEVLSGLNTYLGDEIEINVQLASYSSPTLTAEIEESDFDPASKLALWEPRIRAVTLDGGPAGSDKAIDNLHEVKDGSEVIRRAHFYGGASDYITSVKIVRDDLQVAEQSTASMRYHLKRRDVAPQDAWYHFDPCAYGNSVEAFNTAHDRHLYFIPTYSTALADVTTVVETLRRKA